MSSSISSPGSSSASPRWASSSVGSSLQHLHDPRDATDARALGLLRAMGAGRSQVIVAVVIEAAIVGALAAAGGFGLGLVVARLLMSLVDSLGFRIPTGDIVVLFGTAMYTIAVGLGVTVGAALWPAFRAARSRPSPRSTTFPRARHHVPAPDPRRDRPPVDRRASALGARASPAPPTPPPGASGIVGRRDPPSSSASLLPPPPPPATACRCWPGRLAARPWPESRVRWRGRRLRNRAPPRRPARWSSAWRWSRWWPSSAIRRRRRSMRPTPRSRPAVIDTTQFTGFSPDVVARMEALPEVESGRVPVRLRDHRPGRGTRPEQASSRSTGPGSRTPRPANADGLGRRAR